MLFVAVCTALSMCVKSVFFAIEEHFSCEIPPQGSGNRNIRTMGSVVDGNDGCWTVVPALNRRHLDALRSSGIHRFPVSVENIARFLE